MKTCSGCKHLIQRSIQIQGKSKCTWMACGLTGNKAEYACLKYERKK